MNIYHGTPVSQGIETGIAVIIFNSEKISIPKLKISEEEKEPSWRRFEDALKAVTTYYEKLKEGSNKEQTEVIETYIMMLSDLTFISQIKDEFFNTSYNLEFCIKQKTEDMASHMRSFGDEYFVERANDIEDVFGRVILTLLGRQNNEDEQTITSSSIVLAENLTTASAMSFFKKGIKGLILKEGGISSHISILARTYGIPMMIEVDNPTSIAKFGENVIIDTTKSLLITNPDKATLVDYERRIEEQKLKQQELNKFIKKRGVTKDGVPIKIYANISSIEEAEIAKKEGADGIGLFRTEFLFMNDEESVKIASENEQFRIYSQVLKIMGGKPVTIRTLDCGGDKITSFNDALSSDEKNPLLGCRAIRFCLKRKDIFKTQLKALFRASVNGNLQILIPMVTNLSQTVQIQNIIEEVKKELDKENLPYKKDVPLGIMIETPCAAVMIDDISRNCDFFSIGTNDLTQYMIAVDRENSSVSHLYNETNPSVLRMIAWATWVANQFEMPISVCGEMASRESTLKYLLAYGIRNVSVNPKSISATKAYLSKISISDLSGLSKDFLWNKKLTGAVKEFVNSKLERRHND